MFIFLRSLTSDVGILLMFFDIGVLLFSSGYLVSEDIHSFLPVIDPEAVVILFRSLTSVAQFMILKP